MNTDLYHMPSLAPVYWAGALLAAIIAVTALIVSFGGFDAGYPGPHQCHEDEYQYVTPDGLACVPIDNVGEPPA